MFETAIIEGIQKIRTSFGDMFFRAVTNIGDEIFFIVVAVVMFWCVDKRFGFKLINVYLLGSTVVEGVKAIVRRPRPFTHEGIVSVGEETSGWSFPSGHSHSIADLSTQLSMRYKKYYVIAPAAIITLLVAFSRLYLGQHFLSDVLTGLALGVGLAPLFSRLFELLGDREEYIAVVVAPVCFVVLIVLLALGKGAEEASVLNVLGGYSAVTIGYFIEKRFVRFDLNSRGIPFRILRAVLGLAIVLAAKEGMKFFLPKEIPALYNFFRYFVTGLVATVAVPVLFRAIKI